MLNFYLEIIFSVINIILFNFLDNFFILLSAKSNVFIFQLQNEQSSNLISLLFKNHE